MKVKILFSILLFPFLIQNIFAGAWTQKKGNGFYKFDFRLISADKVHGPDGDNFDIPRLNDFTFDFYGEYGITDRLTVLASFPFFKITTLDKNSSQFNLNQTVLKDNVSGIGDINIGSKYLITKYGNTVLSAGLIFGIPTGKSYPTGALILGDGEFNQAINFQLGHSFYPTRLYYNISVMYNNRTKGYSDEINYSVETGYTLNPKLTFVFRFKGKNSFKNGDSKPKGGFGNLFADNQEFISFTPEIVYNFNNNFGISGSYEVGAAAKNIFSAPVLAVGIFFKN